MALTKSIVPPMRDAALTWFGELVPQSREVGHGPQMAAHEPASRDGGKDAFGEGVPVGRLNPAIPEDALRKVLRVGTPPLAQTNRGFHRVLPGISA
jgi:hypothetical protein